MKPSQAKPREGGRQACSWTHELLSEMLRVLRSTVSSITRALQGSGLIRQGRGVITVTDRAGLGVTFCECYSTVRRTFERLLPYTDRDATPADPRLNVTLALQ